MRLNLGLDLLSFEIVVFEKRAIVTFLQDIRSKRLLIIVNGKMLLIYVMMTYHALRRGTREP